MNKTLKLSFSLKNTYRVNSILYSLKQLPLIKKLLPAALYKVRGLKIAANVLSVLWEIVSVFLGKLIYFLTMVCGTGILYKQVPEDLAFLHILLFLTAIGAFMNTSIFNPTMDKYYAIILMRMNAKEYTLVNYFYGIIKVIAGFMPFTVFFGISRGVPLWLCLIIPFSVAGLKLAMTSVTMYIYKRNGSVYNENKLGKYRWLFVLLLLGAAYGLPAFGIVLPGIITSAFMIAFIPAGIFGIKYIVKFDKYHELNQQLLSQMMNQLDTAVQMSKKSSEKVISADIAISSRRKGFEYLNELFIKRHQKILWKSTKRIAYVCAVLSAALLTGLFIYPEIKANVNAMVLSWLPYFVFILYAINRGTGFTRALFMNCDHSLLTYPFYKNPKFVLKLFRIRLREIMKINVVPAIIIGSGLSLALLASGGTDNPLNYIIILVSLISLSLFFSVHYLTIYYLLQPYNAGTELKSGTYSLVMSATYLICFFMMRLRMSTFIFGIMTIIFCILYSVIACMLVYRFGSKTFKLRT